MALLMKTDPNWRCNKCGKGSRYATQTSVLSVIPFVCVHIPIDFSEMPDLAVNSKNFVTRKGGWFLPKLRPHSRMTPLQRRCVEACKGTRPRWYLPRYSETRQDVSWTEDLVPEGELDPADPFYAAIPADRLPA